MSLTAYVGHFVVQSALSMPSETSTRQSWVPVLLFALGAIVFAAIWFRFFRRVPGVSPQRHHQAGQAHPVRPGRGGSTCTPRPGLPEPANGGVRMRLPLQDGSEQGGVVARRVCVSPAEENTFGGHHVEMTASHSPPLAVDDRGNALISFVLAAEDTPPRDAPLPLALVALWQGDRVLMVFDRYRQAWELPGGRIDPGESPRQAAARELLEESDHVPEGPLRFVGFACFALAPDQRAEYGALFTGQASEASRLFQPNGEIAAVRWWDLREPLPGRLQPMDAYLAELTRGTPSVTRHGTNAG
jgi:ADP-ribose pyrophosphatase YjhB (NUDIX family)